MSKVEKDEKIKKTWKGLLSACPSSGEIVEHLELDRWISEPLHARKDNFSFQLNKGKERREEKKKIIIKKGKKGKKKHRKQEKKRKARVLVTIRSKNLI